MEVVALLLYVGAVWVAGAICLFMWNVKSHGHEHADRLAILPLEDNWTDPLRVRTPSAQDSGKHEPS
jgi:nitrogen fixation-related uncharacterized protein